MNKIVAVHLHGPLGERFGALHHFAINSPREALWALDANYPGFMAAFVEHERYGILVDDDWRDGELAYAGPVSKEVHFVPEIQGNVPIAVIALGAIGITGMAATIIGSLLVLGLMIGISLLFRPKAEKPEAEKKDESFIFTGPENVTGQGVAVPLIYGRVFAGSVIVSAGQDTVDMMTTTPAVGTPKPAVPSTKKPVDQKGQPYTPPINRGGSHFYLAARRQALTRTVAALDEEPIPPPWPDLDSIGAGVDHLRDPPPDGWPPIIEDPVYVFKPEGWIPAKYIWVTEEEDENRKQVMVWQPDYETVDYVYNWNMIRGFYVTDVGMEAEEEEWIAGMDMETPVDDPSP